MAFIVGAAIIATASLAGSAISASAANKKSKQARDRAKSAEQKLADREAAMEARGVINPFDQMTDLSGMINNPMANLQVSTEAAQFQAEQADIALANQADLARSLGFGGGGATALAQAALQSKRGISADIAKQEAANELARAKGEQAAMEARVGEARRMQAMTAEGSAYEFEVQENRDYAAMDRYAGMAAGERTNQNRLSMQSTSIWANAIPNAVSAGVGAANAFGDS